MADYCIRNVEGFQVETGCAEVCDLLSGIAAEHKWLGFPDDGTSRPWLVLFPHNRYCGWTDQADSRYKTLSVAEFIQQLRKPLDPPIEIDGCQVSISSGGIKVGKVFVDKETVREIYKRFRAVATSDD